MCHQTIDIDSVLEINGLYHTKEVKSVMSHYKYVHAGIEILSMSKRIMNKVFEVSNDCGVKIYYQNTDSTHVNYEDADKIANSYKEEFNQDLLGQGLGDFHVDLPPLCENNEVYGIENHSLGKRTYLDMLESTNEEGHILNGEHLRMRGIPTACIKYDAEQKRVTVLGFYKEII